MSPVSTDQANRLFPDFDAARDTILNILNAQNVPWLSLDMVNQHHHGEKPSDQTVTLLITIDGAIPRTAIQALVSIRSHLKSQDCHVRIEFVDGRLSNDLSLLPIRADDKQSISIYQQSEATILDHLKCSGLEWVSVMLIRRGLTPSMCEPTILIGAEDADKEEWDVVVKDIRVFTQHQILVEVHHTTGLA